MKTEDTGGRYGYGRKEKRERFMKSNKKSGGQALENQVHRVPEEKRNRSGWSI
ncbi:MAG: hypothetical protein ACLTSZ_20015 [Lachnospiraceae bacterium]